MAERPAVNPNVDDVADRAKHGYATGTKLLAETHYRLLNWPALVGSTPTSR
jgi:hypothetical protein